MYRLFLCFLFSAFSLLRAQEVFTIEYETIMVMEDEDIEAMLGDMNANLPIPLSEVVNAYKAEISQPQYYELTTSPEESVFKSIERVRNEQPSDTQVRVTIVASSDVTYKNLNEQKLIQSMERFRKSFLLEDSLQVYDWKISRESKTILGYEVRKATFTKGDNESIVAWYAPKIPIKNGPADYHGLPGLILQLEVTNQNDNYSSTTVTTAVKIKPVKGKPGIVKPSKGEKVNREELDAYVKEQNEKMNKMQEGGVDKD